MTNELPKIMADIATEIEAKKAYRRALKTVKAMRKAGKSAREIFEKVCNAALLAVCAHPYASPEELTIKVRYLAGLGLGYILEPDQSAAFYKSLLPEGEEIAAI